jgi:branched-chain amino acid transport system substrate-binding protein
MTLPIYGSHGNARQEFITGAGADADGVKIGAGHILLPETYGADTEEFKTATTFISDFKAATGEPPSTFAGHAYDAIHLIANAAKSVQGELTPAALRDAIEKTSGYPGIGGVFTFSPTDHSGLSSKDLTMYVIKGGTWTAAQ